MAGLEQKQIPKCPLGKRHCVMHNGIPWLRGERAAWSSCFLSEMFDGLAEESVHGFPMGCPEHPGADSCPENYNHSSQDPQFDGEDNLFYGKVLWHKPGCCWYFEMEQGLSLCGVRSSRNSNTPKLCFDRCLITPGFHQAFHFPLLCP